MEHLLKDYRNKYLNLIKIKYSVDFCNYLTKKSLFIFFILDLTTSYGYYGSISFPIRPPSPFADGLIWSQISNQRNENEDINGIWPSSTKHLPIHYNTNNSNNNIIPQSPVSSRASSSWKQTFDRILKRKKSKKTFSSQSQTTITHSKDCNINQDLTISRQNGKHVHWIDDDQGIFNICHDFVENLKLFVQNIINDKYENIYLKNCQIALDELQSLTDCSQLKQAFEYTIKLANKYEKNQLLQQQTFIAHLISRTVLSS